MQPSKQSGFPVAVSPGSPPKPASDGAAQSPVKPLESDRRTIEEQEFDRLVTLADASVRAGRLDDAKELYEKCRPIRKDAKVEQKLALIAVVAESHGHFAGAKASMNDPGRLIEKAIKLEELFTAFARADAPIKQLFRSAAAELQTETQWLFGRLTSICENVREQCADCAASAYNKSELVSAQKQILRLAEALKNAQRQQEQLLADAPSSEPAKSGSLPPLAKDIDNLIQLQRKCELIRPAYQLLRKVKGQGRFSMEDRERLAAAKPPVEKVLAILADARTQLPAGDRPWLDAEIKGAEQQRDDLRVLEVLFGFERMEKPLRMDRGPFATAPAEWPREFNLQVAFAAGTGVGAVKNSFLERGDKDQALRLTSGKTLTLSSRRLEVQLVSKSPVGEDVVLVFGTEKHFTGYLPNLTVGRVPKFKPSFQTEYEFTTSIAAHLGIDVNKPLPQKPINLRIQCTKDKDAKSAALRIWLDDKPVNTRPTNENPKGEPLTIRVNDDFCQVRLALHNAPGLIGSIHQLLLGALRAPPPNDGG